MVSEVFDTRSIPVVPFVFVPEAGKDEKNSSKRLLLFIKKIRISLP